jgi:hypothetical protein
MCSGITSYTVEWLNYQSFQQLIDNFNDGNCQTAQATGQKRPDIGQLSWPVTVPVNGMLRQFPGAGNLFFK